MKTLILALSLCSAVALAQNANPPTAMPTTPKQEAKDKMATTGGAVKTAKVFFMEPKDGATVPTKFKVKMGVEGVKVRPAGEAPDEVTSGHHHLIVDGGPTPAGTVIPADATHVHFGKGQAESELTLSPGPHTLTLQFADGAHRSYGDKLSQTIHINVK